ncbi:peptidase M24, structural domain-containing protein [Infundibulicybe gibba]|nr:peptidase M24, structural domain-containing protein [Infundibulicybe gibba]
MTGTKKSMASSRWGYGWGVGKRGDKQKEMEADLDRSGSISQTNLPLYKPPTRSNSKSTQASRSTQNSHNTHHTQESYKSHNSKSTHFSKSTHHSQESRASPRRPQLNPYDSSSTLVGSALERKINDVDSIKERVDTTGRLEELRKLMEKDALDYYVVPSADAHQSEYVAASDKRRQFISGFTGTREQLDSNWRVVQAGAIDEEKDWIAWLLKRLKDSRVGLDARMISHENATHINSKITQLNSKLVYPPQNLIDLIWKDKPPKSKEPVYLQPIEYTGKDAGSKLNKLRDWIKKQPHSVPSYSKSPPTPSQMHVGTLVTSLPAIAYLLNLRGSDVPFNPVFQAYLFVGLDNAIIFLEACKANDDILAYFRSMGIERRDYVDFWSFLRKREWGEGKLLISPQTSYAISLMLTHFRYTVAPSYAEEMMALKNAVELDGMKRAYLRDGVSFVRFLAWLEAKLFEGYEITEYEAASRLTEFRRHNKNFMGLAYENISASGPNAALPHYSPRKTTARMIDKETPYLNDSGGQYRDGTCDTTRTVHFGRPTPDQSEAYTRVLQGHIAIDSAVFPEGTSGHQLDVLARKALWKDGLNYMHGTGHGFGSFLTVHEGSHSFSSQVPLQVGHVITNEPGFYSEGRWGMRIESALFTRGNFNGDVWLGFERLTCVPIQTRMVKENMLTKEEKQWLKEHNQRCYEKLAPFLKDDKRALKWLKREAERGIGLATTGPAGIAIDWD